MEAEHPTRRPLVGGQVRRWRRERGLTLAQVAARSGLNVGYLSQIENDKASPSLEALGALGAALEVPVAWFLMADVPPPRLVRAGERQRWVGPGGVRVERVDGGLSRDLSIVEARADPGFATGAHAHRGDEHHVILEGRYRMTQGDHVLELGPGDYVLWDGTVPHDAQVIGDEEGRILIITMRGSGSELSRPPASASHPSEQPSRHG
jgi:transcriptional regulator with XRE-family HTH domain